MLQPEDFGRRLGGQHHQGSSAHLGAPCGFIGKTSSDKLGTLFRQDLATAGVEPHVLDSQSATGHAIALVSPNAERTFATHLGAAVELSASEIDPKVFAQYDYFYIEGYLVQNHELIENAVKMARSLNMKVAIDLASYNVVYLFRRNQAFFVNQLV